MFSNISSISHNVTSWLGGTQPDDDTQDEKVTSAQSEAKSQTPVEDQPAPTEKPSEVEPKKEADDSKTKPAAQGDEQKEGSDAPENDPEASLQDQLDEVGAKAVDTAKEWGTWLYGVGQVATKEIVKTAKVVKDKVEEKTILGEFSKEQDKFVTENTEKKKKSEVAVAPWIGYNEEDEMKKQILALSKDQRNFLRSPPSGVQFQFDYSNMSPVASAVLQEDPNLSEMRFKLVPKAVKEEAFWRNYFYRVSLIKQSAQLTSMAQNTGSTGEPDIPKAEAVRATSQEEKVPGKQRVSETEADVAGSPPENEFISDAFQESHYDEEALKKEMEQLGVDDENKTTETGDDEDVPEWERELQAELQEYEVVAGGMGEDDEDDADLEKEILQQLQDEK